MNPWDFSDIEPSIKPNTGSDCSIDLKLGGAGGFGFREDRGTSSPSKRARAPSTGSQNVSCLVDGCKSDLSGCREYHKRHKVCEVHSKTAVVSVGGQEQRFCQQCSRFHFLVEFDKEKRSCRKRLDGHNRRRRKPQPDSINSASSFTNYQGNIFSSCSQMFSTATTNPHWPINMKYEEDSFYSQQQQHYSSMFPRNFKESKHFPILQFTNISQPLHNTTPSAESSSSSSKVLGSECALSLLSSQPLAHIAQFADGIPMGQPLLSFGGGHVSSTAFSDVSDPDINCTQGLFGVAVEGSSSDGGSQTLPFSW